MSFNPEWTKIRFQAELPKGFDGRTVLQFFGADLLIVHPEMVPHILNRQEKIFEPVKTELIPGFTFNWDKKTNQYQAVKK